MPAAYTEMLPEVIDPLHGSFRSRIIRGVQVRYVFPKKSNPPLSGHVAQNLSVENMSCWANNSTQDMGQTGALLC